MPNTVIESKTELSIPSSERLVRLETVQDARMLRAQLRELQKSPILKLAMLQLKQTGESIVIHSERSYETFAGRGSDTTWDHRCELKFSLTLTPKGFGWSEDRAAGYDHRKDESYIDTRSGYILWTSSMIRLMKSGLTIEKVVNVLNDKIQVLDGAARANGR